MPLRDPAVKCQQLWSSSPAEAVQYVRAHSLDEMPDHQRAPSRLVAGVQRVGIDLPRGLRQQSSQTPFGCFEGAQLSAGVWITPLRGAGSVDETNSATCPACRRPQRTVPETRTGQVPESVDAQSAACALTNAASNNCAPLQYFFVPLIRIFPPGIRLMVSRLFGPSKAHTP